MSSSKSTCPSAIQNPSFFPTPPPHSNSSQHNSPNSVASSGHGHNHNHKRIAASPMAPMANTPMSTVPPMSNVYGSTSDLSASFCDYPASNYPHYPSFVEHSTHNHSNSNCFEHSNSQTPVAVSNYPAYAGAYETDLNQQSYHTQHSQHSQPSHNYYPTVSDFNLNYKMNNNAGNWQNDQGVKNHCPKVNHAPHSQPSHSYGQYTPNEYASFGNSFGDSSLNHSLNSNSYSSKSNGLYFGEYGCSGQQSSHSSKSTNWHTPTYPLANNNNNNNYHQTATDRSVMAPTSSLSRS
ncbi:hypothetical protein TYRP_008003 [Tyrophagus putrescentiae]|nr:hypothetical protein TYRP_008003 [Tyrophagus putrescentiae]